MHISWAWPCTSEQPGNLGLALVGGAHQSVFNPVFCDGWGRVPPCRLAWGSPVLELAVPVAGYGPVQEWWWPPPRGLGPALLDSQDRSCQCPDPAAGHCGPTPSPELPKRSQASLPQSLAGSWFLSPGFSCACGFVCVLQQSLFPRPMEVLQSNPAELQIPRGFPFPLPDPQVGKSVVGPRTCTAVRALWYSWSPVCGSSTWWLYGRANSAFLQEGFCCTPCCPGLLPSVPLSPRQATAHPASTGDPQTLAVWPRLLRWSPLLSLASSVPSKSMPNRRFDFKCGCTPPAICSWTRGIFFWWVPRSSFRWLSSS